MQSPTLISGPWNESHGQHVEETDMQTTVERESVDAAVIRLAAEAARRGVRVFRAAGPAGSEWFCPSSSRPGTLHRVTAYSCDCRGFARHQRCGHHSALLAHMGWLPAGDPDPDPVIPVALAVPSAPCPDCQGEGVKRVYIGGGLADWQSIDCRCRRVLAA
jgi:hypothetical protein